MEEVCCYPITPVPKPRMTKLDKWKKRDCVMRYWEFKDEVKRHKVVFPEYKAHVTFHMPMPKSWSKKKKLNLDGQGHKSTPDLDNLLKALFDALFINDSHLWDYRATKVWAYTGAIIVVAEKNNA